MKRSHCEGRQKAGGDPDGGIQGREKHELYDYV